MSTGENAHYARVFHSRQWSNYNVLFYAGLIHRDLMCVCLSVCLSICRPDLAAAHTQTDSPGAAPDAA